MILPPYSLRGEVIDFFNEKFLLNTKSERISENHWRALSQITIKSLNALFVGEENDFDTETQELIKKYPELFLYFLSDGLLKAEELFINSHLILMIGHAVEHVSEEEIISFKGLGVDRFTQRILELDTEKKELIKDSICSKSLSLKNSIKCDENACSESDLGPQEEGEVIPEDLVRSDTHQISEDNKIRGKINYKLIAYSGAALAALIGAYWLLHKNKPSSDASLLPTQDALKGVHEIEGMFHSKYVQPKEVLLEEDLNKDYFTEKNLDEISSTKIARNNSDKSDSSSDNASDDSSSAKDQSSSGSIPPYSPFALIPLLVWLVRKYWTGMSDGLFARPYRERFRRINTQYGNLNEEFRGISVCGHNSGDLDNKLLVAGISFPHENGIKVRLDKKFAKVSTDTLPPEYVPKNDELLISFKTAGFGLKPSLMLPVPIGYEVKFLEGKGTLTKSTLGTYQLLFPFYCILSKVQYVVRKLPDDDAAIQIENINSAAREYAQKKSRIYEFFNQTRFRRFIGAVYFMSLYPRVINTVVNYLLIPPTLKPSFDHSAITFALNEASQDGVSFHEKYQIIKDALTYVVRQRESRLIGKLIRKGMRWSVSPFGDSRISFDEYLQMIGELNRDAASWLAARLLNRVNESHQKTVIIDGFRVLADKDTVDSSRLESNLLTPLKDGVEEVFDYVEVSGIDVEEPKGTEDLERVSFIRKLKWFIGTTLSSKSGVSAALQNLAPFKTRSIRTGNIEVFGFILNRGNHALFASDLDYSRMAPTDTRWNESEDFKKHVYHPKQLDESLLYAAEKRREGTYSGGEKYSENESFELINEIRDYIFKAKNPMRALTVAVKSRKIWCSSRVLTDDLSLENELIHSELFDNVNNLTLRNRVSAKVFVAKVLARHIQNAPRTSLEEIENHLEFQNRCFEILGVNVYSSKRSTLNYFYAIIFKKYGGLSFINVLASVELADKAVTQYVNIFNTIKFIIHSKYLRRKLRGEISSFFPHDEVDNSALKNARDVGLFKSILNIHSRRQLDNLIYPCFDRGKFLNYVKSGSLENAQKYGYNLFHISRLSFVDGFFLGERIVLSSNFKDQTSRERFIREFSQRKGVDFNRHIKRVFDFQIGSLSESLNISLCVSDEKKIVLEVGPKYSYRRITFRPNLRGYFSHEFARWAEEFVDTSIPELCPDKRFQAEVLTTSLCITEEFFYQFANLALDNEQKEKLLEIIDDLKSQSDSEREAYIQAMNVNSRERVLIREIFDRDFLDDFISLFSTPPIEIHSRSVSEKLAPGLIRLIRKSLPRKSDAPISHKSRASADGYDFHALREYVDGDPLKSINHTATSRAGKIIVNQYEEPVTSHYRLVVSSEWLMNKGSNDQYANLVILLKDIVQLSRQNKALDLYVMHYGSCIFKLSREEAKELYHEIYHSNYEAPKTRVVQLLLDTFYSLRMSRSPLNFEITRLKREGIPIHKGREKVEFIYYGNSSQNIAWKNRRKVS